MKTLLAATLLTFTVSSSLVSFGEETSLRNQTPNKAGTPDFSPLHLAAMRGDADIVRKLLDEGQTLNQKQKKFGGTPLQYAVAYGHIEVTLALLEAGGQVDAADNFGRTPLMWAAMKRQTQCMALLLAYDANVNARADGGWTALHYAAQNEDEKSCQLLVNSGALVTIRNSLGKTAVDLAPGLNVAIPWSSLRTADR